MTETQERVMKELRRAFAEFRERVNGIALCDLTWQIDERERSATGLPEMVFYAEVTINR